MTKSLRRRIVTALVATAYFAVPTFACTSAIVSAKANPYGRPVLWKHRDTSTIDNKIEYIPSKDGHHAYVALFNALDSKLNEAWMGMNDSGFAVMNTASYNIKDDKVSNKKMDKEGVLMSKALKTCVTVDDFEELLKTYPRPMGVEANFGVIDAYGNGAYFETNNHSYVKFDLADEPSGVMVRTNYSHSGRKGEGYGHIREKNAEILLQPYIDDKEVSPEILTEVLSRTFFHSGRMDDETLSGCSSLLDVDYIPRYKSTATIAIEGCEPIISEESPNEEDIIREYVMWTGMGYPPVAEILPVKCSQDGVPSDLKGTVQGKYSQSSLEAKNKRNEIFKVATEGKSKQYLLDISKLYNLEGNGLAQTSRDQNLRTYAEYRKNRSKAPANTDL